jgi:4'-phosphopantetheinyl transferase EntD
MIEEILPPEVASAEAFDDPPGVTLYPEEEAVVARSVDKRRREFTTARACARRAMGTLGLPPAPIVPGERGAPIWPPGVVGSMTHCDGYRASAVALARRVRSVGLDAEPNGALPDGVLDVIATPAERDWLKEVTGEFPGVSWDRLLFSAKESVYKAWFPLTGRWLDFEEAIVTPDPRTGRFAARLCVPGPVVDGRPLTGFAGRWLVRHGLVATAITVMAADGTGDDAADPADDRSADAGAAQGMATPNTGGR